VLFSIAGGEDLTMFEIQDAAKVITESIDPEAKIIFGTVRDDKLKKNEIKITVIATGFPETSLSASSARPTSASSSAEPTISSITRSTEKGKIYNPAPEPRAERAAAPAIAEKAVDPKKAVKDDDDDWGAVPAFLRRSRLK